MSVRDDFPEDRVLTGGSSFSDDSSVVCSYEKKRTFYIGIIIPEYHEIASRTIFGFTSMLAQFRLPPYKITIHTVVNVGFNAVKKDIASHLNEHPYDLILSYGVDCTLAVYDLTLHYKKPPHIVFVGMRASNALLLGLIQSYEYSGNHITGVPLGEAPFKQQFEELCKREKRLKNILVVYNSQNSLIDLDVKSVERICALKKFSLDTFEINNYQEYETSLKAHLERTDLAVTLRDSFTTVRIDTIARLSEESGAKLCASDWYSINEGASFGYGYDDELVGVEAAYKAYLIFAHGLKPSDISMTLLHHVYSLRVREPYVFHEVGDAIVH